MISLAYPIWPRDTTKYACKYDGGMGYAARYLETLATPEFWSVMKEGMDETVNTSL